VESHKQGVTNTGSVKNDRNISGTVQKTNPINSIQFSILFEYL